MEHPGHVQCGGKADRAEEMNRRAELGQRRPWPTSEGTLQRILQLRSPSDLKPPVQAARMEFLQTEQFLQMF